MKDILTHIWTGRVLVIAGFLLGYNSLSATANHIGSEAHMLVGGTQTHSWHHFLRELGGDFGAMTAILVILFAPAAARTGVAWWVMLILMIGFYAPFWVGTPFMPELGAPSRAAEINHLMMAIPALIGCFLSKKHFAA